MLTAVGLRRAAASVATVGGCKELPSSAIYADGQLCFGRRFLPLIPFGACSPSVWSSVLTFVPAGACFA